MKECIWSRKVSATTVIIVIVNNIDIDLLDDDYNMSVERLDPRKGYHLDNCKLVLQRLNCIDCTVNSLYPDLVFHGMTVEKWQHIVQCFKLYKLNK